MERGHDEETLVHAQRHLMDVLGLPDRPAMKEEWPLTTEGNGALCRGW
ncbi:hypothetical protein [Streptomyces sp. NPDC050355]